MVTAMELFVGPLRSHRSVEVERITEFLRYFPNLSLRTVDLDVARLAAELRASTGLATPDALIVASGVVAGARYIVSNDADWPKKLKPFGEQLIFVQLGQFSSASE